MIEPSLFYQSLYEKGMDFSPEFRIPCSRLCAPACLNGQAETM